MVSPCREVAVILARGGSKGIPRKNVLPILGVPLITWTIRQVRGAGVREIYVSTDDPEITEVATREHVEVITRPSELADDQASSESALLHAVDHLTLQDNVTVLMPQVTSPLRRSSDVRGVLELVNSGEFDSAFSGNQIDDICVWRADTAPIPVTYDPYSRGIRQNRPPMIVENGSLYSMRVGLLRETGVRLGGRIGIHTMPAWTIHEIDDPDDLYLCEVLLANYLGESESHSAEEEK